MAVTTVASGTQTATIGVLHTIATETSANVYCFYVDMHNMALGDVTELFAYVQTLSSGTPRIVYNAVYAQPQQEPIKISIPLPSDYEIRFRLRQQEGTGRNYDWAVKTLQ